MATVDESTTSGLSQTELIGDFRRLGIRRGMRLMVHASLRSIGYVRGGAPTVVDALMHCVGTAGTLLMPSFNHDRPYRPGGPGYYDPTETPTSNGAIPEAFWRMGGVTRSLNPTHPFACWGFQAKEHVADHHRTLTMGANSPLGRLWREGGYCLLLGVSYRANTFHHVVEMVAGASCLGRRTEAYPVRLPDGRMVTGRSWGWRSRPCPINDTSGYAPAMRRRGYETRGTVGAAPAILFRLDDCFQVVSTLLSKGWRGNPPCRECPIRPRRVPQTVASDWDDEAGTLRSDSQAWSY
jgi:aminoglycoside 3-N-acetyltransferase